MKNRTLKLKKIGEYIDILNIKIGKDFLNNRIHKQLRKQLVKLTILQLKASH